MNYEINVSLKGKHLFATAERSITDHITLRFVYLTFKQKFPESEGYSISVTRQEHVGYGMDEAEIFGEPS